MDTFAFGNDNNNRVAFLHGLSLLLAGGDDDIVFNCITVCILTLQEYFLVSCPCFDLGIVLAREIIHGDLSCRGRSLGVIDVQGCAACEFGFCSVFDLVGDDFTFRNRITVLGCLLELGQFVFICPFHDFIYMHG